MWKTQERCLCFLDFSLLCLGMWSEFVWQCKFVERDGKGAKDPFHFEKNALH